MGNSDWDDSIVDKLDDAAKHLREFYSVKVSYERKITNPWITNARKAREALNRFWEAIKAVQKDMLQAEYETMTDDEVEATKDMRVLSHWQKDDFLESLQADLQKLHDKREQAKAEKHRKREAEETSAPEPFLQPSPKRSKTDALSTEPEKPIKRRQLSTVEEPASPPRAPSPVLAPPRIKISVPRVSYDVFERLWPNQSRAGGKVRWAHYKQALVHAGFKAKNAGGSMVRFSGDLGTIVFHCPHGGEATEIPEGLLRRFGHRLRERFGLSLDSFKNLNKAEDP